MSVCYELLAGHGEAGEVLEARVDLGAVRLVAVDERLGRRHVLAELVRRDDRRHLLQPRSVNTRAYVKKHVIVYIIAVQKQRRKV